MKSLLVISLSILLLSCNSTIRDTQNLQKKIDSLEAVIATTYKPGFGELMGSIQIHHSKLWFAGIYKNWKLADFEIHELKETLESIKKFQKDRPETEFVGMLDSSLDSLSLAIKSKNSDSFKESYQVLTNACNRCHRMTNFEFNRVSIPSRQVFSNQLFQPDSLSLLQSN